MKMINQLIHYIANQHGATLIIGILTLSFLTIIGVFSTLSTNLETKSASTDRSYRVSFYAAELALQVAEASIETLSSRRQFNESATTGHYGQNEQPEWKTINWQSDAILVSNLPANFHDEHPPSKLCNRTKKL